jgi:hypothetical protein
LDLSDPKFCLYYGPELLGRFATMQDAERAAVEHHSGLRLPDGPTT